MGLILADSMLGMVRNYRVLTIGGRFGGGKSALAHMIAYWLLERGHVRYLISNVRSVWRDNPEKIEMRGGKLVDAVVILDEAGIFLETGRDAKKFLAYLRKMNIILIMPTVLEPSKTVQFLTAQRTMTYNPMGVPLWWYRMNLRYGSQKESYGFGWWKPHEIFGIYDTSGAPEDDGGLDYYVKQWTKELQTATGTKVKVPEYQRSALFESALSGGNDIGGNTVLEREKEQQFSEVENSGRASYLAIEAASRMEDAISLFERGFNRKGRS